MKHKYLMALMASVTTLGLGLLATDEVHAIGYEEARSYYFNIVDSKTAPKYIYIGETGYVVNPQFPDFRYGVALTSADEGVVSIANQSDWKAERTGKTQVRAENIKQWILSTSHREYDKNKARIEFLTEELEKAKIPLTDDDKTDLGHSFDVPKTVENGYWDVNVIEKNSMFRLYNPNSGEHFYTADREEATTLWGLGWQDEEIAWVSDEKNEQPVYRLYNPNAGDHHYTLDVKERDELVKLGWKYEGESWYSGGTTPLYRVYNPNAKAAGAHHFTKSAEERDALVAKGWKAEGIAWYGK